MAEIHIETGKTDGSRYIGIQPPLNDEQIAHLEAARNEGLRVISKFSTVERQPGNIYSEVGVAVEAFNGIPQYADEGILEIAKNIAKVLADHGDTVMVREDVRNVAWDSGHSLFDRQA